MISGGFQKPVFGESFSVPIPLNKIYAKTLQVNVLSVVGQREEIVVRICHSYSRQIALSFKLVIIPDNKINSI